MQLSSAAPVSPSKDGFTAFRRENQLEEDRFIRGRLNTVLGDRCIRMKDNKDAYDCHVPSHE